MELSPAPKAIQKKSFMARRDLAVLCECVVLALWRILMMRPRGSLDKGRLMDSWNPREDTIRPCSSHHVLIPVSAELVTAVRRFSQTGIQDFLTLTLTERSGLLYVGAREALFAFSVEALELQGVVRGGAVGSL